MNLGLGLRAQAGMGDDGTEHIPKKILPSCQKPQMLLGKGFFLQPQHRGLRYLQRAALLHFVACFCNQLGNKVFKLTFPEKKTKIPIVAVSLGIFKMVHIVLLENLL